jgi:hypothetical protein
MSGRGVLLNRRILSGSGATLAPRALVGAGAGLSGTIPSFQNGYAVNNDTEGAEISGIVKGGGSGRGPSTSGGGMWDWADPNKNGLNASIAHTRDVLDPQKNGVAQAFDPEKNGVKVAMDDAGAKIKNEFDNPDSFLNTKVKNEFVNPDSILRSKVVPGIAPVLDALVPGAEIGTTINSVNNAASKVQKGLKFAGLPAGYGAGPPGGRRASLSGSRDHVLSGVTLATATPPEINAPSAAPSQLAVAAAAHHPTLALPAASSPDVSGTTSTPPAPQMQYFTTGGGVDSASKKRASPKAPRKPTAYNDFIREYAQAHKGMKGRDLIKAAASAWKNKSSSTSSL